MAGCFGQHDAPGPPGPVKVAGTRLTFGTPVFDSRKSWLLLAELLNRLNSLA